MRGRRVVGLSGGMNGILMPCPGTVRPSATQDMINDRGTPPSRPVWSKREERYRRIAAMPYPIRRAETSWTSELTTNSVRPAGPQYTVDSGQAIES